MKGDVFHEGVVLRMAYTDLVHHVCVSGTDPDTVPLADVLSGLDEFGVHRFGGLLFAYKNVDSIEEGIALAIEVESMVRAGERPRPLKSFLSPEEQRKVEASFRRLEAAQPWWKRLAKRVERALVADEETSAWMDQADREMRMREGRLP